MWTQTSKPQIEALGVEVVVTDTIMASMEKKSALARTVIKAARRMITALVPAKALDQAKGRLAELLTEHERRSLSLVMLEDVLRAVNRRPRRGADLCGEPGPRYPPRRREVRRRPDRAAGVTVGYKRGA